MIRTLICCAMSLLVSALPSPPADDRPHLAVAIDAARFIQAAAVATPNGTTWPANPADRASVAADLYSGSPASSCSSSSCTARPASRRTSRRRPPAPTSCWRRSTTGRHRPLHRARRHRLRAGRSRAPHRDAKYRDGMRRVVALLQQRAVERGAGVEWNEPPTSSAGSAGIGLFLLHAAEALEAAGGPHLAARAGRRLIELGRDEAGGIKWPMSPDDRRG